MSNWNKFDKNKQTQTTSPDANSQTANSQTNQESKGLFKIPESFLQFVPFLPLALESMTGQKIPPMGGTMGEIQMAINQIVVNQQQIITNQSELRERLINLETNAVNQFNNIDRRIETIQSIKLTHERERKQIEYNPNKHLETNHEN